MGLKTILALELTLLGSETRGGKGIKFGIQIKLDTTHFGQRAL